jgi:FHS family L-fucose permease-like MFS transporter
MLITSLFLLWGFAHGLLDVLNKHFQNILHVSKAQSGFVQFSLYIGYFVMAVPAGLIMKRFGYKRGIVFGLLLFATGAFLFYPAGKLESFWPFLLALFVIACGLTCLETAANPYSTVLGPKESASQRINFSQSFNGLGWILGPLLGGLLIFGASDSNAGKFDSLLTPYMLIGSVVLVVAVAFIFTSLPEIREEAAQELEEDPPMRKLLKHPFFIFAVIAQFAYVAAQTGVNSFFINYVTEELPDIQNPIMSIMQNLGSFGEVFTPKNPAGGFADSCFRRDGAFLDRTFNRLMAAWICCSRQTACNIWIYKYYFNLPGSSWVGDDFCCGTVQLLFLYVRDVPNNLCSWDQ